MMMMMVIMIHFRKKWKEHNYQFVKQKNSNSQDKQSPKTILEYCNVM